MTKRSAALLFLLAAAVFLLAFMNARFRQFRPDKTTPPTPAAIPPKVPQPSPAFHDPVRATQGSSTHAPKSIPSTSVPPPAERDVIANEVVLTFFNSAELAQFKVLAGQMGLEVLDTFEWAQSLRLRITDTARLEKLLAIAPKPTHAEANVAIRVPQPTPAATFDLSSYLGFGDGTFDWLGIPDDHATWGKGITIAVLDTAMAASHGLAVSSLINGNGSSIPGTAPAASLMPLTVLTDDGIGDAFTLAKAIVQAVDAGADIINLSVGTYGNSSVLADAVAYAIAKGVVLVAASGNDGETTLCYPAAYDGVLAVGAIDAAGQQLPFSNTGMGMDLAAPGLAVLAASTNGAGSELASGTSMAAPLVSGAIAAVASMEGTHPTNAAALLLAYANDEGLAGVDSVYGEGIMNIQRALNHDTPGIVDVALGTPWITRDANTPTLHIYVENRGSESVSRVTVSVLAGGLSLTLDFYNLEAGETEAKSLPLTSLQLISGQSLDVTLTATLTPGTDAFPSDNVRHGTILTP